MISVRRLSHATFETPDVERQVDHYTNVVGLVLLDRQKDRAILGNLMGQENLIFERGSAPACPRLAFQIDPSLPREEVVAELKKRGLAHELRSDISCGVAQAVVFKDPKGTELELFWEQTPSASEATPRGVAPFKLGHIAFSVPSAPAMAQFYTEALGFRVSDWMGDYFVFMRCGPDHHTVNFLTGQNVFMHHMAFELKDWAHVSTACEVLGQNKIPIAWGPGRHEIGHNVFVYYRDPDDHVIEFFTDLDLMKDESLGFFEPRPWHKDRPQRPKVWDHENGSPIWGLPPSPAFRKSGNRHLPTER